MTKKKATTKKVVINTCFGGFSLSPAAILLYAKLKGKKAFGYVEDPDDKGKKYGDSGHVRYNPKADGEPLMIFWFWEDMGEKPENINKGKWLHDRDIARDDETLVAVVEKLKARANGRFAQLKVVEIPADVEWEIDEYDGSEQIDEAHRSWS